MIKEDYRKILDYHHECSASMTLVCSMQHYQVPYGVCEVDKNGSLVALREKPELDFLVNAGMYLINPDVLEIIPSETEYHITHLVRELLKRGKKVSAYPVSENSYVDIGQWAEYKRAVSILSI